MYSTRHRRAVIAAIALLIAAGIAWRATRETPEDLIVRLGGKVTKSYLGSPWFSAGLRWLPGGAHVLSDLSTPIEVDLSGTTLGDESAHLLSRMDHLHTLRLDRTRITDEGCRQLGRLHELRVLTLSETDVGDAGLYHLRHHTQLAVLDLTRTRVTGAGLRHLENLAGLKELSLVNTNVCGRNLEYLSGLPNLQTLDLSGTPLCDDDFERLRGMRTITFILRETQVTEDGLARLRLANRIVGLDLTGTQVNDDVFDHFLRYPDLGRVNVTDTHVTQPGIDRFYERTTLIDVQAEGPLQSGPLPE
jgi:internalin A